jgi:TPR repeat protein
VLGSAARLYQHGCARQHARACHRLARLVAEGLGIVADERKALDLERLACEAGELAGCRAITEAAVARAAEQAGDRAESMLDAGVEAAALGRLREACDGAEPLACTPLARRAAGTDPARAAELFGRACRAGDQAACLEVARAPRWIGPSHC